jgi:pimeloyl-ACP methyl ester carboxylesterase
LLGCQVIVDPAVRYPRQVRAAILVGPTVDRVDHTFARQLWRAVRDLLREPWSLWPILVLDYWATGTKRLLDTCRLALSDPVQEKFRHMNVSTLIVRGGRDTIAPQRWVEEVVKLLPCGQLAVIPSGTHATNYSAPDELARIVSDFIANLH